MRNLAYDMMVHVSETVTGPILRKVGKQMYQRGTKMQGDLASEDRLVPSLRNLSYQGQSPSLEETDFVAPTATVLGNVNVGYKSSIWYGATLNGTNGISIGDNTVIQDRVHISQNVNVGDNVFVGPNSILQGSTIENRAFVSMGATVRHATVEKGAFVAAGAVVEDGAVVKEGEVWAGNPARFLRLVTPLERQVVYEHLQEMQELACIHSDQTEKTSRELLNGYKWNTRATLDEFTEQLLEDPGFNFSDVDEEYTEQRTLLSSKLQYPEAGNDYEPYAFDMSAYSEKFNVGVHNEDVKRIATKLKQKAEFETDNKPWTSKF